MTDAATAAHHRDPVAAEAGTGTVDRSGREGAHPGHPRTAGRATARRVTSPRVTSASATAPRVTSTSATALRVTSVSATTRHDHFTPRDPGRAPYVPRSQDEGGMAIKVDPRRLGLLKELAAAADLRPGQLVQRWVEERLDAERAGQPLAQPEGATRFAELEATVASLVAQVADLAARTSQTTETSSDRPAGEPLLESRAPTEPAPAPAPRRRGRPRKADAAATTPAATSPAAPDGRVALHDEIIAVIGEKGPSTAAEIADSIRDRGRYHAPRSSRPLDAAMVNGRVSNPAYRARFVRSGRRIGLAS